MTPAQTFVSVVFGPGPKMLFSTSGSFTQTPHRTPTSLWKSYSNNVSSRISSNTTSVMSTLIVVPSVRSYSPCTAGAASPECVKFLHRLHVWHVGKYGQNVLCSGGLVYVRWRLSFALLRAAIMCLRGSRSTYHCPVNALRQTSGSQRPRAELSFL